MGATMVGVGVRRPSMVATPTLLPPPSSLWEDTTQDVISGGTTINWGQAVSSLDPHGMLTKTQKCVQVQSQKFHCNKPSYISVEKK